MFEGAKALAVEIVHHAQAADFRRAKVELRQLLTGQGSNGNGKAIRSSIGGGERPVGSPVFVLEATKRDRPRPQPKANSNPVDRLESGQLLLVHQIDPVAPAWNGI